VRAPGIAFRTLERAGSCALRGAPSNPAHKNAAAVVGVDVGGGLGQGAGGYAEGAAVASTGVARRTRHSTVTVAAASAAHNNGGHAMP